MAKIKRDRSKKKLSEEMKILDIAVDKNSLSAKETRKLFKRGNAALNANNYPLAAKHFFKAWEADPDNLDLLTVVAHILTKLGHQAVAINFLEQAIAKHGLTEDICKVMGEMAISLGMYESAEKIFSQAVNFNPQEEKYYIKIAESLERQGNAEGAIQFMEEVVKVLDNSSDCWAMLATLVKNYRLERESQPLFEKALKLNPKNAVALNNFAKYAYSKQHSMELLELAIKSEPNEPEPHVMLSMILFNEGSMKEAWKHYEYRHYPSRGSEQAIKFTHGLPIWDGRSLHGKTIFLAGEQGIGDEILFSLIVKQLLDRNISVHIGCDERLISIFERSFPGVKAYAYQDETKLGIRYRYFPVFDAALKAKTIEVDYAHPIASIGKYLWKTPSEIPVFQDGYLTANNETTADFALQLNQSTKKTKIGLSWRSGYTGQSRDDGQYIGIERLLPLISAVDAEFICLQYDCKAEEIELIKEKTGKTLRVFDGIDLKKDIEANLAIMKNLDVILGPNIATQMFAIALGCEVWIPGWNLPWWHFGKAPESLRVPHAPRSRYFLIDKECKIRIVENPWEEVVAEMTGELQKRCREL